MHRPLLTLVTLLCLSSPALAENLVVFGLTPDAKYAVDTDSLKRTGDVVQFWNAALDRSTITGKQVKTLAVYTLMNCKQKMYRQQTFLNYDVKGRVFSENPQGEQAPLQPVKSGELTEDLWEFVCH